MKTFFLFLSHIPFYFFLSLLSPIHAQGTKSIQDTVQNQTIQNKWNGHYFNEKFRIDLHLDLDSTSLIAPGFENFGTVNGYMRGNIFGTWFLVRHEFKGKGLLLRLTNDLGSYTQTILLEPSTNGTISYTAVGNNEVRRTEGRKLIKIDPHLIFIRK